MLTITSVMHPAFIRKIRAAMYYASKGQGHMMEGHGKRCYIQNRHGCNIMRLDWVGGKQGYVVWGEESRNITPMIREALQRMRGDVQRLPAPASLPLPEWASKPLSKGVKLGQLYAISAVTGIGLMLSGCTIPF